MHSLHLRRRTLGTYVAAFLLGALIALILAQPARGATPAPLDRIGVVRFSAETEGMVRPQNAILHDCCSNSRPAATPPSSSPPPPRSPPGTC